MFSMFVWIDGLHALLQNYTHLADGEKGLERAIIRKIEYQSVNVVIGRTKISTSKKQLHILTAVVCILTAVCCRGTFLVRFTICHISYEISYTNWLVAATTPIGSALYHKANRQTVPNDMQERHGRNELSRS